MASETKNWTEDIGENTSQTSSRKRKTRRKFRRRQHKRLLLSKKNPHSIHKSEQHALDDASQISDSADSDEEEKSYVTARSSPLTKKARLEVPVAPKREVRKSLSTASGERINKIRTPRPPLQRVSSKSSSLETITESDSDSVPGEAKNQMGDQSSSGTDKNNEISSATSFLSNVGKFLKDKVIGYPQNQHLQPSSKPKDDTVSELIPFTGGEVVQPRETPSNSVNHGTEMPHNTSEHSPNSQNLSKAVNRSNDEPDHEQLFTPNNDLKKNQIGYSNESEHSSSISGDHHRTQHADTITPTGGGQSKLSEQSRVSPMDDQELSTGNLAGTEPNEKSLVLPEPNKTNCVQGKHLEENPLMEQPPPEAKYVHNTPPNSGRPDSMPSQDMVESMSSGDSLEHPGNTSMVHVQQLTSVYLSKHDRGVGTTTENSLDVTLQSSNTNEIANHPSEKTESNVREEDTIYSDSHHLGTTSRQNSPGTPFLQKNNDAPKLAHADSIKEPMQSVGENIKDGDALEDQYVVHSLPKYSQGVPQPLEHEDKPMSGVLNHPVTLQPELLSKDQLNESFSNSSTDHDIDYTMVKSPNLPESVVMAEIAGVQGEDLNIPKDAGGQRSSLGRVIDNGKPETPVTTGVSFDVQANGSRSLPVAILNTRSNNKDESTKQLILNVENDGQHLGVETRRDVTPILSEKITPTLHSSTLNEPSKVIEIGLTIPHPYGHSAQCKGYIKDYKVSGRPESPTQRLQESESKEIWDNLHSNLSSQSVVDIPTVPTGEPSNATSIMSTHQTQRELSRFHSHRDLVNLIEQGILDHDPICSSPTVSATNNICTTTNYEMMGFFHQQLALQMEDLDYIPINAPLSDHYRKYGHILVPELLIMRTPAHKNTERFAPATDTSVELQNKNSDKSCGKIMDSRQNNQWGAGDQRLDSEGLSAEPVRSMIRDNLKRNSSPRQKDQLATTKGKVHGLSRLKWKQEWERKLQHSRIYMPPISPSSCITGDQITAKQQYDVIRDILRSNFHSQVVDVFDEEVDILITGSNVGDFKDNNGLEHITNTSIKPHSGKRRRVWSVEKLTQFITNMGVNLDTWQSNSGAGPNYTGGEAFKLPQNVLPSDRIGDEDTEKNVFQISVNDNQARETQIPQLSKSWPDTQQEKNSETSISSAGDNSRLLRNVEELLDQAITSLEDKENELSRAREVIEMLANEAIEDQLRVSSLYGSLQSAREEKRAACHKLVQLKEGLLLDTIYRRRTGGV